MNHNGNNYEGLKKKYFNWFKGFKKLEANFARLKNKNKLFKKSLKSQRDKFQEALDTVSDLNYQFFLEIIKLKEMNDSNDSPQSKINNCETYLGITQTHIQRIQSLYIFPITLELSELASKEAKTIAFIILIMSIIFTSMFSIYSSNKLQRTLTTNINNLHDIIGKSEDKTAQIIDSLNDNSNIIIKFAEETIRKIDLQLSKADLLNSTLNQEIKNLKMLNTRIEGLKTEVKRFNSMPSEKR